MKTERFVGRPMRRREDRRLLAGKGRYIADIHLARMVHVAFARSSTAHARIRSIDVTRALALPGVLAIYTAADLAVHLGPIRGVLTTPPAPWRKLVDHAINIPDQPLIADKKVRYVGEPYAIVVAESRYVAEDAVELIEANFDPLPVLCDPTEAMRSDAVRLHESVANNIVGRFRIRKGGKDGVSLRR